MVAVEAGPFCGGIAMQSVQEGGVPYILADPDSRQEPRIIFLGLLVDLATPGLFVLRAG